MGINNNHYSASISIHQAFISLFDAARQAVDTVNGQNSMHVVNLDALGQHFIQETKQFIAEAERVENTCFLHGNLSALWAEYDSDRFRMLLVIYVENSQGKALLKSLKKAFPLRMLDETSAQQLKIKREIRFAIMPEIAAQNADIAQRRSLARDLP